MFTIDEEIGADASDLFNFLTGYSNKKDYRKLLVAPYSLRDKLVALIDREIEHQKAGRPAHIIIKVNAMTDKAMIQLLYQASQAGLKVDLFVRGICCLRPGIPGISENITVTSILGPFLEHSRIYYFKNAGEEVISSGARTSCPVI
jgi:polyphosphate kinase